MTVGTGIRTHIWIPMGTSSVVLPDTTLDYHAHILPGCDHGSDSVETSRRQLEMARKAGVATVCATPHFYPQRETVACFLDRRARTAELLRAGLPADAPRIQLGAEVLICDGLERMQELPLLCREGTDELLLELPFYPWQPTVWQTLWRLCERDDIRLVVAHADRYPPENIRRLTQEGVPLQLNADCLRKPLRRRLYLAWIRSGYVPYLGSDMHMLGRGYRDFALCRDWLSRHLSAQDTRSVPEEEHDHAESRDN